MDTSQVLACSRSAEGKHINAQEAPMQFLSTETEGINNQTKGSVISGLTNPGPPMLECSPPSNRVKGPHPFPEEEDRGSREHRSTKHSQETTLRNSSCGAPTYSVQTVHNNMHDGEDWNGGNSGSIKAEGKIRSEQHRKHGEGGMDTVHKKKSLFHVIIFGIFCALCLRNA
ncbi:hypothetical protein FRC02_001428 [Tulasnella sp. 418]|nr:hypothetical protein FRC02_001428 [Tulasnella sp. 418]